ncbi:MAG: 4-hydroxybenzoate octaprenyltransferase [Nitrospirae bacterium]|nr:4-hydroxybenzoate octaprenyltransferase [Candidatus Troglogloeales bacterium]
MSKQTSIFSPKQQAVERLLSEVVQLMRLNRPYGTLLLLFPTLWSLLIASSGRPVVLHLIVFILGSFFMRSAGCVMNDMADYQFDAQIQRTKNRPLAKGSLTHKEALFVLIALLTCSLLLVLLLNPLTIGLSFMALFFALLYPFAKRVTHGAQVVLGITFSFGILMAWTAVEGELTLAPILILMANLFWTCGYDTIYAMMDKDDDIKIGVKSTAVFFGSKSGPAIGLFFALVICFLLLVGQTTNMGSPYYLALGIATAAFVYQTVLLCNALTRERLFSLFKGHVFIGGVILVGIILNYF